LFHDEVTQIGIYGINVNII